MQQSEKSAAEAKTQGHRAFRLKNKRAIVELKLLEGFSQRLMRVRFNRIQTRKNHRLCFFEGPQRLRRHLGIVANRVPDLRLGYVLDVGDQPTDFAGFQLFASQRFWGAIAQVLNRVSPAG